MLHDRDISEECETGGMYLNMKSMGPHKKRNLQKKGCMILADIHNCVIVTLIIVVLYNLKRN